MNMTASSATQYVQDTVFESGYIVQQRPVLLSYVAASAGLPAPDPASPFVYLELGCSLGATLNGLAASNPHATFYGIDFNAEHIRLAKADADAAGLTNVHYHQANFTQFETLDLPQADYIAIHGTYSWIDPEAEDAVHAIVKALLKDGGLFYVDYMSMPGNAPVGPMWALMRKLTESGGGNSEDRARSGVAMLKRLEQNKAQYFIKNPEAKHVLEYWSGFLEEDPNGASQLAHYALAPSWQPKFFRDVSRTFADLGLSFAGSTDLAHNDLEMSLPEDLRPDGTDAAATLEAEAAKDFFHHTQQRHDVFVKTSAPAQPVDAFLEAETKVGFMAAPSFSFRDPDGNRLKINDELIAKVQEQLSSGPTSIAKLSAALRAAGFDDAEIASTLKRVLTVKEASLFAHVPSHKDISDEASVRPANSYNEIALADVTKTGGILYLAAPKIGGCIVVPALVSAIVATLIDQKSLKMSMEDLAQKVRAIPGVHRNEHGFDVEASQLPTKMVASAYDMVMRDALPGLVAVGALDIDA